MSTSTIVFLVKIGLALYRINKLLDETDTQRAETANLRSEKETQTKHLEAIRRSLQAFQADCAETTRKRHHVKFAIRSAAYEPTPEVMSHLEEYAFDDEAQLEPIEKYLIRTHENI